MGGSVEVKCYPSPQLVFITVHSVKLPLFTADKDWSIDIFL